MRYSSPSCLFLDGQAHVVDVGDHRVQLDLDAHLLQPALRLEPELGPHRRQHRGCGLDEDHPGLGRVDGPERPGQGPVRELGDLADDLDARRSGADHDEGQPACAFGLRRRHLGGLERAEDPAAQFERVVDGLHAGRERLEMVVAEVGLLRACGHDQAVERRDPLPVQQLGGDGFVLQVDPDDVAEQTSAFFCLRKMIRVAGAISPTDRMPVAT